MRSSVVESYPPAGVGVRGSQRSPFSPPMPGPGRPVPPPVPPRKRRLPLAPAEGWSALLFLGIAVYSVVYAMITANWVSHSSILLWSTAAGLLMGLIVSKIPHISQAILHLGACLIGHWLSIFLTSIVAFHISWTLLISHIGAVFTDLTRLNNSGEMVFLFYLSFLCFFLGYFGSWLVYRAHLPWLVALVYCSILLVNLNYIRQDLSLVVVILLLALMLLIARVQLANQLSGWKSEGLYTDRPWIRHITARVMWLASLLALLALLVSWILPVAGQASAGTSFWNSLDNIMTNISHGHISLQDPGSIALPYQAPTNFFGDQLTIAGTVNLPSGDVLYYTSTAAPQYLEGFTYDRFDGHTWTSLVSTTSQNFGANAHLPLDTVAQAYPAMTTIVTVVRPPESGKHYLFAPAQPSQFNISTTIYGNGLTSAWAQPTPLATGERYQVISLFPNAKPQDLVFVPLPSDNPDYWRGDELYTTLATYYFSVPGDLSPAVIKTARQWTQGATNTYDFLKLLETHLSDQQEFTYSLSNPPVPGNIDAVDWLLQTHRGYCTYYATAMTIMARLLGVPTRMVNGFSHGHFDAQQNRWVIAGSDAHSWVQAYLPSYGWINFDPTPGYSLAATPSHSQPTVTPGSTKMSPTPVPTLTHPRPTATRHAGSAIDPTIDTTAASAGETTPPALLVFFSFASLIASLLFLLFALWTYWWRSLYRNASFVAGMFWRLCRVAGWAGISPQSWQTPYEYSHALGQQSPREAGPLWRLTELFVRERWAAPYQARPLVDEGELERLRPGLRRLLFGLFIARFKKSR